MTGIARWRGRAALVALLALTVDVLARPLGLVLAAAAGADVGRGGVLALLLPGPGTFALLLTAGLLVGSGFLAPVVAPRRGLALWGGLLAAAVVLFGLVAVGAELGTGPLSLTAWSLVTTLAALAVPLLVGWGLLVLRRGDGAAAAVALPAEPTPVPEEQPDPELEPTWTPDAASGAVWRTAGEAARGASPARWEEADDAGRWSPAPREITPGPSSEERPEPGPPAH